MSPTHVVPDSIIDRTAAGTAACSFGSPGCMRSTTSPASHVQRSPAGKSAMMGAQFQVAVGVDQPWHEDGSAEIHVLADDGNVCRRSDGDDSAFVNGDAPLADDGAVHGKDEVGIEGFRSGVVSCGDGFMLAYLAKCNNSLSCSAASRPR